MHISHFDAHFLSLTYGSVLKSRSAAFYQFTGPICHLVNAKRKPNVAENYFICTWQRRCCRRRRRRQPPIDGAWWRTHTPISSQSSAAAQNLICFKLLLNASN